MKRFYSLLLLLTISIPTFSQASYFSPANNNEFEAKVLRVFEWVLEARFSSEQRRELSWLVQNSVRSNDQAAIKSFQDVAKLNDLIDSIPAGREAEARAAIQPNILEALRKQPDDPIARLLLSVYNASRVSSSAPQDSEPAHAASTTAIPAELVGEWRASRGSGTSYYNPNSSSYGAPNGTVDSYKFFADGSYEHAILIQNSLYNCTIRVFGRETGRTLVEGNTLAITPGPGTWEYTDNCRPQMNSKKVTHMESDRWQWEVRRDEQGVKLCVRDQQGASACYSRQ